MGFVNFWKGTKAEPVAPSLNKAQTVRVDSMGRVVFSTPQFRPHRDFHAADTVVVMPTAGVVMRKATTWLRSEVPRESLRVQSMWQAALAGGHGHGWVHGDICKLCGVSDADVRICPLCLLHSHPSCWLRVLRGACASGRCAVVNCASIPRFFESQVCSVLCAPTLCGDTVKRERAAGEKKETNTCRHHSLPIVSTELSAR